MIYPNKFIELAVMEEILLSLNFNQCPSEGLLTLSELLIKANAGYYNSHTEEAFMRSFGMLKKDRKLNKLGSKFICEMFYNHSNLRPNAYGLMTHYRRGLGL